MTRPKPTAQPEAALRPPIYVNGRLLPAHEATISALDRGFTLGDGVFETMRACGERVLLLERHLERLRAGAAVLELPLPPLDELRAAITATLRAAALPEAVARLTISRGPDTGRGLESGGTVAPTVVVRVTPFAPPEAAMYQRGVAAVVAEIHRNDSSPLARIKSCNYGDSVLARRAARRRGTDEALLLNTRGEVACGASANVFAVIGGTLYTPPVESGVLAGITRGAVLELATELGLPARVEPLALETLRGADEAFFTNTVAGVLPLTRLDGQPIGAGAPGPLTQTLAGAYDRVAREQLAL